jgi:hypothetical protein
MVGRGDELVSYWLGVCVVKSYVSGEIEYVIDLNWVYVFGFPCDWESANYSWFSVFVEYWDVEEEVDVNTQVLRCGVDSVMYIVCDICYVAGCLGTVYAW